MKGKLKTILIILGVVLFFWGLNKFVLKGSVSNLVFHLYRGPGTFISRQFAAVSKYGRALFGRSEVISENERLKKENADLLGQLIEADELRRENETLRNQLGVAGRRESELLIADAFSLEKSGVSSTIMIDKGAKDGVRTSMPVIAGGNILAGVVSEVFDDFAKVILLDDPRSAVNVKIGGSQVIGSAKGLVDGKVAIEQVTNTDPAQEGDLMTTSGLDNLPESLFVGKIEKVGLKSGSLFKEVEARLFFNAAAQQELFVVLN